MQRLNSITNEQATGRTKQIFDGMQKALGTVPNLVRVLANSPAAVNAYASFSGALSASALPAKTREAIAIAVANANSCDYCLSAHTVLGKMAGLAEPDIASAQNAQVADAKTTVALQFATKIVQKKGIISAEEVNAVRAAGYTDGEITEIVAETALNIFTNYFNNIAQTDIDFPVVKSTISK